MQRQLLLALQRERTLESLYDPDLRPTKRQRHSYLQSVTAETHKNSDGTVDMLLVIRVAPTTYERFNVMWSAKENKHVIYVRDGLQLLRTNSVRPSVDLFGNVLLTHTPSYVNDQLTSHFNVILCQFVVI